MNRVLAVVLAGGRGERLSVLTGERTKPAIPFAGRYRIIDFTLSNCVNSGIHNVAVLTQYQPLSLAEHIGIGTAWGLAAAGGIRLLHPYLASEEGRDWYKGTADAVYQNLQYIKEQDTELVLVLSGDHVYKMDYSWMLKFHEEKQADVTLSFTPFPEEELEHFGTVTVDEAGRVTNFEEKVRKPKGNLVSMGVYLFKKDVLQRCLAEDAQIVSSTHDFGRDVLPRLVGNCNLFAYSYEGYWRDIGTIQSYWQSNMDMIEMSSSGYLSDAGWPIRTNEKERPSAIVSEKAKVVNSLVSNGCVIRGQVEHSIFSPGVIVAEGAVIKNSVIMSDSIIGSHSIIDRSILDKEVVVAAGCHIGFGDDFQANQKEPKVLNSGITIVGKRAKLPPGLKIGRNCTIFGNVTESDFRSPEIQSGKTVRPKQRRPSREV